MHDPVADSQPKTPITVRELDELVDAIFDQREKIEKMEAEVTLENKKLASMEAKAVAYLEELDREKYQHTRGTISINEKWRFNLPATEEDKQAFFGWLREKGIFDKYATVNANSYNSLLMAEWEAAKKEGNGMDFSVPGVPEPKFHRALSARRGK